MKHPDARIEAVLAQLAHPKLAAIDLSLARVAQLLALLGNPHDRLPPVVHVAGTNGKGSLVAYLTSIMGQAGYRVHRYISPHLVKFNEQIMLAGADIGDEELLILLQRVAAYGEACPVTFFEATTIAAMLAFSEVPGDIVLLETGLGGRLDATNMVAKPALTALTPISMDHMDYLGDSIEAIAGEKVGILKQGVPCVVGPQRADVTPIIERKANELDVNLYSYGKNWLAEKSPLGFRYQGGRSIELKLPSLPGTHQIANAATAIACIEQLQGFTVTDSHIRDGLAQAQWPARLQRLESGSLAKLIPTGSQLWLDGGHNPAAAEVLGDWLSRQVLPVHIVCAMMNNKDIDGFLAPMASHAASFTAIPMLGEIRAQNPEVIAAAARALGLPTTLSHNIKEAIEAIVKNNKNDFIILICGSLYLAGDILWQNSQAH